MDNGYRQKNVAGNSSPQRGNRRFDLEREEMITLLRKRGIRDERLLQAMSSIDRSEFVSELFINRAYEDSALPIGQQQTISQPFTVAYMTACLGVNEGDKILEIGTGSGYQATVLAAMGARVFTIERHMELLNEARQRIENAGYHAASKCGDGTIGWREYAPFDGIIVTAGGPEVPRPLLEQLKDGGCLVIPIGEMDVQSLHIIQRLGDQFETTVSEGFKFVPLIGIKGWK